MPFIHEIFKEKSPWLPGLWLQPTINGFEIELVRHNMLQELCPKPETTAQFIFVEVGEQPFRLAQGSKIWVAVDAKRPIRTRIATPSSIYHLILPDGTDFCVRMQMVITFMAPLANHSLRLPTVMTHTQTTILHARLARLNTAPAPNAKADDGVRAILPLLHVRTRMNDHVTSF